MMTSKTNWSYPTTIWFGAGRIVELAEACRHAGIKKPLLVTDKGLANLPITQNVLASLAAAGFDAALFAEVDPNPTEINMEAGLVAYKTGGYDGVIAFGGGSSLDLGKVIALMVGQTLPVWDFEDIGDWWKRANAETIAPIIAVPTTAGTGSEVGRASVITNSQTAEKKIIFHPKILPSVVICDPELTVEMPDFITAGTGMDAFAHCLEAFSSPHYHPMSQGIALVKENLTVVYDDPANLTGRAHMMSAAMMGATAFQKGLGAIHALSHPIGAIYNTHHGTTNAVVMQAVMRFNRSEIEDRFVSAARYLDIEGGFDGFYDFVGGLVTHLNIPKNLTDLGLRDLGNADLDRIVATALNAPSARGNPRALTAKNTRALLEACF